MNLFEMIIARKLSGGGGGGSDPSQGATATAGDIKLGKTAAVNGSLITGTSEAITPSGTIQITQNGTVNVAEFESASINVPEPNGIIYSDLNNNGYPTKAKVNGIEKIINKMFYNAGKNTAQAYISRGLAEIVLCEGITEIGDGALNTMAFGETVVPPRPKEVGTIVFPSTAYTFGDQLCRYTANVIKAVYLGDVNIVKWGSFLDTGMTEVIYNGNVNRFQWESGQSAGPFPRQQMQIIDMSHCTSVPQLDNAEIISGAADPNGCVLKVPQSLLADWQDETNWIDVTGVTWQGV